MAEEKLKTKAVAKKAPAKKAAARKIAAASKNHAAKKAARRTVRRTDAKKSNPNIGGSFNDFLAEEGVLAQCQAEAAKRVIAWQLQELIEQRGIAKAELARSLHTSRHAIDRMLDPENTSMTLNSLGAVADFLGKKLDIRLS